MGPSRRQSMLILIAIRSMKPLSKSLHEYGLSTGERKKWNSERTTSTLCLAWRSTNRSTSYRGKARILIHRTYLRNGILRYPNTPLWNERGSQTPFLALMLSHSTEKGPLLDEFKSSPISQRFVSYASRLVAGSHSIGIKG